jgi:uncharacterized phage protein gp47/JayE
MYENITYELILQRMISRVLTQNANLDTREGSIIYNALAPAAVELQNAYIQLDAILNETFADTASRPYLIRRAAERGITPTEATNALLRGEFNIDIPVGSRFSLADTVYNYTATERISAGVYQMRCETVGTVGNDNFGALIPIDPNYIAGLTSAQLTALLVPGEDEEATENIRQKYMESLDVEAFGGNVRDYKDKVNAIAGVGGVKVYPTWDGGGTVKLTIIASDYSMPTDTLINTVQTAIDPIPNQGVGFGIAPIGHTVTVVGVTATTVNTTTQITYKDGWTWETIKPYAEQAIDAYFLTLSTAWADSDITVVRISQIETRLLGVQGVLDITGTTLNGVAENLTLPNDTIPTRGTING